MFFDKFYEQNSADMNRFPTLKPNPIAQSTDHPIRTGQRTARWAYSLEKNRCWAPPAFFAAYNALSASANNCGAAGIA